MLKTKRTPAGRFRGGSNIPVTVRPAKADIAIARTGPAPEEVARALTWGADEKVLLVLAAANWILSRGRGGPLQRDANHALLVTAAAFLPRERPYRAGRCDHWHKVKNRKHPAFTRVAECV